MKLDFGFLFEPETSNVPAMYLVIRTGISVRLAPWWTCRALLGFCAPPQAPGERTLRCVRRHFPAVGGHVHSSLGPARRAPERCPKGSFPIVVVVVVPGSSRR